VLAPLWSFKLISDAGSKRETSEGGIGGIQ